MSGGRQRIGSASVLLAIAWFVFENRRVHPQIDDAYIFYRYAKNLVLGHGFVFNVGERVEGVTSLLWTWLIAGGVALGIPAPLVAHGLGVGLGALLLWLTYLYAATLLPEPTRPAAALAPWLVALTPSFAIWMTAGLETPLFAVAVLAALVAESRERWGLAALAAAVSMLIRPEGAAFAVVLLAVSIAKRRRHDRRLALAWCAAFLLLAAALTGFRLWYFGMPLPNTFYAKVSTTVSGWAAYYVASFVVQTLLPALVPSAFAMRDPPLRLGVAWTIATFGYVIAVGGDAFRNGRFFLAIVPVVCALTVRGAIAAQGRASAWQRLAFLSPGVCAIWYAFGPVYGAAAWLAAAFAAWLPLERRWTKRGLILGAALAAVFAAKIAGRALGPLAMWELSSSLAPREVLRSIVAADRWSEVEFSRAHWEFFTRYAEILAQRLEREAPRDKLVAAAGIGALGYYSDARILDLLGLVDPTIAKSPSAGQHGTVGRPGHQRSNAEYVLSRKPDFILVPPVGTQTLQLPAVVALWENEAFRRDYSWVPELEAHRKNALGPR